MSIRDISVTGCEACGREDAGRTPVRAAALMLWQAVKLADERKLAGRRYGRLR